jgi:hypothetical protein
LALPWPWFAALAFWSAEAALAGAEAFWSALAAGAAVAFWSAALLPVVVLVALWSVAGAGVVAAAPLCAFWSVALLELEAALLSFGTVLVELGAGAVPLWLFTSPDVPLVELEVAELELAPGAVAAFWSVVVDGAAVGFAWPGVWLLTSGVVEVWPLVALGAVFEGVAVDWLELAGELDWFISELLLEDGVVLDDGVVLEDEELALGVWFVLFWSGVVLDVWPTAIPADSSKAEHV